MDNKINVSLSKDLRKKYGIRSFPIAAGDVITIRTGSRKGEGGKVVKVNHRSRRITVDGITIAKADAKQEEYYIPSNICKITRLDFSSPGRLQKVKDLAARKNIVVEDEPEPEPELEAEETESEGEELKEGPEEETEEESEEELEDVPEAMQEEELSEEAEEEDK